MGGAATGVQVQLLGVAQDAGLPQAGCECHNCVAVRTGIVPRGYAASLALIERSGAWLIDATPDFREQIDLLRAATRGSPLRGILLTHAHVGHYAGLIHLGREAMNTRGLTIHATPSMIRFLEENGPWSQLITLGNIAPAPLEPGRPVALAPDLRVEAIPVPHRGEFSDTVAFVIRGPSRTLFYCPDIDRWDAWNHDLRVFLDRVDVALLDGTFYSADELPGRNLEEIPHPAVKETIGRIRGTRAEVRFIHLNHSNPLHRDSPERRDLRRAGFDVAQQGQIWEL